MTDCPFIPSTADRLLQQHRPSPPVCRGPESRKDGAKRLVSGLKADQSLGQNLESAAHNTRANASVPTTISDDRTLSP
jgi:hypothetical protein